MQSLIIFTKTLFSNKAQSWNIFLKCLCGRTTPVAPPEGAPTAPTSTQTYLRKSQPWSVELVLPQTKDTRVQVERELIRARDSLHNHHTALTPHFSLFSLASLHSCVCCGLGPNISVRQSAREPRGRERDASVGTRAEGSEEEGKGGGTNQWKSKLWASRKERLELRVIVASIGY